MIDHFGINCSDWAKSQQFYDTVLGVLGFSRQMDYGVAIGYGRDGKPDFWIGGEGGLGKPVHCITPSGAWFDVGTFDAYLDATSSMVG